MINLFYKTPVLKYNIFYIFMFTDGRMEINFKMWIISIFNPLNKVLHP